MMKELYYTILYYTILYYTILYSERDDTIQMSHPWRSKGEKRTIAVEY
jgi:hypothetical protein